MIFAARRPAVRRGTARDEAAGRGLPGTRSRAGITTRAHGARSRSTCSRIGSWEPDEDEIWLNSEDEPTFALLPLFPRLALTLDIGSLGEDEAALAEDLIDEPRRPKQKGRDWAAWLLGEARTEEGSASGYASASGLQGDDWINLLAVGAVGSLDWGIAG
jgi:hypothetical protein